MVWIEAMLRGTPGHGLASGRDRRSVEPAGMLRQIGSASDGGVGRMALVADPRASGEAGSEDLLRSSQGGDHGMEMDLDGCSRGNPPPAVRDSGGVRNVAVTAIGLEAGPHRGGLVVAAQPLDSRGMMQLDFGAQQGVQQAGCQQGASLVGSMELRYGGSSGVVATWQGALHGQDQYEVRASTQHGQRVTAVPTRRLQRMIAHQWQRQWMVRVVEWCQNVQPGSKRGRWRS